MNCLIVTSRSELQRNFGMQEQADVVALIEGDGVHVVKDRGGLMKHKYLSFGVFMGQLLDTYPSRTPPETP